MTTVPTLHPLFVASLSFDSVLDSLPLALLLVAALIASPVWLWLGSAKQTRDHILLAVRFVASLVLALLLIRPIWVTRSQRSMDAILTVGLDQSASMTLPDVGAESRFDSQRRFANELIQTLQRSDLPGLQIETIGYGGQVRRQSPQTLTAGPPSDRSTNIAEVLRFIEKSAGSVATAAAVGETQISTSAGLVLVGDGVQTASSGDGNDAGLRGRIEAIDRRGIPIYPVLTGSAGVTSSKDISIESLPQSYQLFAGNEFDVRFTLRTSGITSGEVDANVRWVNEDQVESSVASRTVLPTDSNQSFAMTIPVTVPPPGVYRLIVEAPPRSNETVVTNNRQVAFVEVREGGGKILYIEGQPRMEQLFLRRAMRRFPDLQLNYQLIPSTSRSRWPIDLSEQIEFDDFDAFLIGDLPRDALSDQDWEAIADRVEDGAGLITLGGGNAYDAGGFEDSPLAQTLPIVLGAGGPGEMIDGEIELIPETGHPILQFGNQTTQRWMEATPVLGANRFMDPKTRPGVQVLLRSANDAPMMVIGSYGVGRVASLAFDSTWRWWRSGDDDFHRKFWRQLLLWSMDRGTDETLISIEMENRRLMVDEAVEFRAIAEGGGGEWSASIIGDSQTIDSIPLQSSDDVAGGRVESLPPGIYRLRVQLEPASTSTEPIGPDTQSEQSGDRGQVASAETSFEVVDRQIEFERPQPDEQMMMQMAAMTSRHGGQMFSTDSADALAKKITDRVRDLVTTEEVVYRPGSSAPSAWLLFACFAVPVLVQWFLRRRWGMA